MIDKRNLSESEPPTAANAESTLPDPNVPPRSVTPGTAGFLITKSAVVALTVASAIVGTFGGCSYFSSQIPSGQHGGSPTPGRGFNHRRSQPAAVETEAAKSPGVAESNSKVAGSSGQ